MQTDRYSVEQREQLRRELAEAEHAKHDAEVRAEALREGYTDCLRLVSEAANEGADLHTLGLRIAAALAEQVKKEESPNS